MARNFIKLLGVWLCVCVYGSAAKKATMIPPEMGRTQLDCVHEYADRSYVTMWKDLGINGKYSIDAAKLAEQICRAKGSDADSLLGFCRARLMYRGPSASSWKAMSETQPQQSWLRDVYQSRVEIYQPFVKQAEDRRVASFLAYSTPTVVPHWKLKDHLADVRAAIAGDTWTLADAYVFLGVYPTKHSFGWGDIPESYREEYALCIADSLKAILVAQEEREWGEIVQRSKQFEANERAADFEKKAWGSQDALKERIASWGLADVQKAESDAKEQELRQADEEARKRMTLSQSELNRLHKLDVVRAYLFAERTPQLGPAQF